MTLGEKIKTLRIQRGMTLEQVGELVGVGKSTVRKWEIGKIANMRRDKIAKLADALGVTPGYLMGWEDKDGVLHEESDTPPRTIEARIVSGWMDDLPKEQRERILSIFRAMFDNDPKLFHEEEG